MLINKQKLIKSYLQLVGECLIMFDPSFEGVDLPDKSLKKRLINRNWGFSLPLNSKTTTCNETNLSATFSEGTFVVPYSSIFLIECKPLDVNFEFEELIPNGYKRLKSSLIDDKHDNELSFKKEVKKLKKT